SCAPSVSSHLSYPAPEPEPPTSASLPSSPPPRELLKNRLYVGNLHPTVNEHTLIQVFSKFGKLTRLDYLFHKTGALRGKPRSYAFVEYANDADAAAALAAANGKLLRGRNITVTYAHHAPLDAHMHTSSGSTSRRASQQAASQHHQHSDARRPTTLSLLKSAPTTRSRTDDKIAQMEAKLLQLSQASPTGTEPPASAHPSLPAKPGIHPQSISTAPAKAVPAPTPRIKPPLPRVSRPPSPPRLTPATGPILRPTMSRKSNAGLKGVKIVRRKDKAKVEGTGEDSS
ncbi:RNA-binding domain-containing protein, partial [Russula earlei]